MNVLGVPLTVLNQGTCGDSVYWYGLPLTSKLLGRLLIKFDVLWVPETGTMGVVGTLCTYGV